jgi:hypothetical protein
MILEMTLSQCPQDPPGRFQIAQVEPLVWPQLRAQERAGIEDQACTRAMRQRQCALNNIQAAMSTEAQPLMRNASIICMPLSRLRRTCRIFRVPVLPR